MKYADRGLVFGGKVAALYDQLYLTAAITLNVFFYGLIFSRYFKDEEQEVAAMSICLRDEIVPSTQPFKDMFVIFGVILAAMTPSWILYFAARRFVSLRSEGSLPPTIFGRYRRNVVTYNETIVYNTIAVAVSILVTWLSVITETMISVYLSACTFFIITLVMTVKAFKDPFLFRPKARVEPEKETTVFYVHAPEVTPRRYDFPPPAPIIKHKIIYVKPANNNIEFSE